MPNVRLFWTTSFSYVREGKPISLIRNFEEKVEILEMKRRGNHFRICLRENFKFCKIFAEILQIQINLCASAAETRFSVTAESKCSQDWSRLGFVSALPQQLSYVSTMPHLRLDYALASISCEHCRSSRNHPHCVPRHIIYYCSKNSIV